MPRCISCYSSLCFVSGYDNFYFVRSHFVLLYSVYIFFSIYYCSRFVYSIVSISFRSISFSVLWFSSCINLCVFAFVRGLLLSISFSVSHPLSISLSLIYSVPIQSISFLSVHLFQCILFQLFMLVMSFLMLSRLIISCVSMPFIYSVDVAPFNSIHSILLLFRLISFYPFQSITFISVIPIPVRHSIPLLYFKHPFIIRASSHPSSHPSSVRPFIHPSSSAYPIPTNSNISITSHTFHPMPAILFQLVSFYPIASASIALHFLFIVSYITLYAMLPRS